MNHGIRSYTAAHRAYAQPAPQPREAQQAQRPDPVQQAARAQQAAPARQPEAAAAPGGLSQAEQQMIDRYFPASPSLSLRVYGPGRTTRTMNPGALGSRLDLRG